jgi:hypothetical protein
VSSRQAKPVDSPYYFPPPLRRQSQMPQRPVALLHRNSLTVGQRPSTFTGDPKASHADATVWVKKYCGRDSVAKVQVICLK